MMYTNRVLTLCMVLLIIASTMGTGCPTSFPVPTGRSDIAGKWIGRIETLTRGAYLSRRQAIFEIDADGRLQSMELVVTERELKDDCECDVKLYNTFLPSGIDTLSYEEFDIPNDNGPRNARFYILPDGGINFDPGTRTLTWTDEISFRSEITTLEERNGGSQVNNVNFTGYLSSDGQSIEWDSGMSGTMAVDVGTGRGPSTIDVTTDVLQASRWTRAN